jgi:hypothetical protein
LLSCCETLHADAPVAWQKTYGVPVALFNVAASTSDGGFIIVGVDKDLAVRIDYTNRSLSLSYMVKTDSAGNIQWERNYGHYGLWSTFYDSSILSLTETDTHGYVLLTGNTIIKFDSDGRMLSDILVHPYAVDGVVTSDGGCVFICNNRYDTVWSATIVKCDSNCNIVWNQTFNNTGNSTRLHSIIETSDGGYASVGTWGTNCWLLKTAANGTIVLNQSYSFDDGDTEHRTYSISETEDDGFFLSQSFSDGHGNCWFAKIDAQGNLLWTKVMPQFTRSLASIGNDEYLGTQFGDLLMFIMDGSGNMIWNSTGWANPNATIRMVVPTDDGYVAAGQLYNNTWLEKFTESVPIPISTPTPTPSPTQSPALTPTAAPSLPSITVWIIVAILVAVAVGLLGIWRHHVRRS